ncbi:MAG: choice-of-anchor tandem repeat GloVer-containing protein [Chthoniobacter sp.]|uniref:choice-of-anchor tandem repeat GloVer-containing protein n=1 Tax=Chthoniobacter sp. TaxID=2510640 RepID=UPI0032A278E0
MHPAPFAAFSLALALWTVAAVSGFGQDTILHNFTGGTADGAFPDFDSLTLSGSTLYGVALGGGSASEGIVFSENTNGSGFTLLHSFTGSQTDGAGPWGSPVISGSEIFGMTNTGGATGAGVAYSMNLDGSGLAVLHSFAGGSSDGSFPRGSLTLSGTTLYGLTPNGGAGDHGTVFSMNTDGSGFALLHAFSGGTGDGQDPAEGTVIVSGSKLYGMTNTGGTANHGTLFSMNLDGSGYTLLRSFAAGSSDGANPDGSLTLIGSKLYGLTVGGGSHGGGTAFSVNLDGSGFTVLHNFGGTGDGLFPDNSLTFSGSKLYGTASSNGAHSHGIVFEMNLDGSGYTILDNFAGGPADGALPNGNVTLSADGGTLYGMTYQGGSSNDGTLFSLAVPEPASASLFLLGAVALAARRRRATR